MACSCRRKYKLPTRGSVVNSNTPPKTVDSVSATSPDSITTEQKETISELTEHTAINTKLSIEVLRDNIKLPQCYLCAKKHLSRAQIYFEEYHTGYPDRIRLMVQSMRVAESEINKAFQLYCKVLAHMDMSAGEFLGHTAEGVTIDKAHIATASRIREERIKLQDDPLYVPEFGKLLTDIQLLQYAD